MSGPQQEPAFPPASIDLITLMLKTQAEMLLGLFSAPEGQERPKADLPAARHTIDLLAVLQEKTKGNLSLEEQRLLDNSLTELRFRYIQILEESKKQS
jgi:hypothetical protein